MNASNLKMRFFAHTALVLAVLASLMLAWTPAYAAGVTVTVKATAMVLRACPSMDCKIVQYAANGDPFTVIARTQDQWGMIDPDGYLDFDDNRWIALNPRYLDFDPDAVAALPVLTQSAAGERVVETRYVEALGGGNTISAYGGGVVVYDRISWWSGYGAVQFLDYVRLGDLDDTQITAATGKTCAFGPSNENITVVDDATKVDVAGIVTVRSGECVFSRSGPSVNINTGRREFRTVPQRSDGGILLSALALLVLVGAAINRRTRRYAAVTVTTLAVVAFVAMPVMANGENVPLPPGTPTAPAEVTPTPTGPAPEATATPTAEVTPVPTTEATPTEAPEATEVPVTELAPVLLGARIDENGHLLTEWSFGEIRDLGKVTGNDGRGIQSAAVNEAGELMLLYTDGNTVNLGRVTGVTIEEVVAAMPTPQAGTTGANCWDGLTDQNSDGVLDVKDCRGKEGTPGPRGGLNLFGFGIILLLIALTAIANAVFTVKRTTAQMEAEEEGPDIAAIASQVTQSEAFFSAIGKMTGAVEARLAHIEEALQDLSYEPVMRPADDQPAPAPGEQPVLRRASRG